MTIGLLVFVQSVSAQVTPWVDILLYNGHLFVKTEISGISGYALMDTGAGINNSEVNDRIKSRQTLLPIVLQEAETRDLVLFFPLSPSPRRIEITYVDELGDHTLIMDTQSALNGLHLVQPKE